MRERRGLMHWPARVNRPSPVSQCLSLQGVCALKFPPTARLGGWRRPRLSPVLRRLGAADKAKRTQRPGLSLPLTLACGGKSSWTFSGSHVVQSIQGWGARASAGLEEQIYNLLGPSGSQGVRWQGFIYARFRSWPDTINHHQLWVQRWYPLYHC